MDNALLAGVSRQMVLQRELDIVANNVANLNTTGFKADAAIFSQYLAGSRDARLVQDRGTWRDMSAGPLKPTGNPLDVAIDGDGFLAVQTPRGERYTRNGALQINTEGELVTLEGYRVLGDGGAIRFQNEDRNITIARDGTVSVADGTRGQLRMVRFANNQSLQKDGATLFAAPAGAVAQTVGTASFVQGSVEQSNVRGITEMARLTEISRGYSQIASLLQQQDELRRSAIERLADVPA